MTSGEKRETTGTGVDQDPGGFLFLLIVFEIK